MNKKINREAILNAYLHAKSHAKDILEISEPLRKIGFDYFSYSKFSNDVRVVELIPNQAYVHEYLAGLNSFSGTDFFENVIFPDIKNGFNVFFERKKFYGMPDNNIVKIMKRNNICHDLGFMLSVVSLEKNEVENFHFSANEKNPGDLINKKALIAELASFAYYFKDKAKKIIDTGLQKNKQFLEKEQANKKIIKSLEPPKFLEETNRFYFEFLPSGEYLTLQQVKILKVYYEGFSAKEITRLLNLSHRTVETHLNNIRTKCNSHNLIRLINQSTIARQLLLQLPL